MDHDASECFEGGQVSVELARADQRHSCRPTGCSWGGVSPRSGGGRTYRVRHSIDAVANRDLRCVDRELRTLDRPGFTLEKALPWARARGVEVATIIRDGASNGAWSEFALKHWPQVFDLLIEAKRDETSVPSRAV